MHLKSRSSVELVGICLKGGTDCLFVDRSMKGEGFLGMTFHGCWSRRGSGCVIRER